MQWWKIVENAVNCITQAEDWLLIRVKNHSALKM